MVCDFFIYFFSLLSLCIEILISVEVKQIFSDNLKVLAILVLASAFQSQQGISVIL